MCRLKPARTWHRNLATDQGSSAKRPEAVPQTPEPSLDTPGVLRWSSGDLVLNHERERPAFVRPETLSPSAVGGSAPTQADVGR